MKKIILIASTLLAALSFASCVKELEIPQKGTLELDNYYAEAGVEEAERLIARAYNDFFNGPKGAQPSIFLDIISDDMWAGGGTFNDNSNEYQFASSLISTPTDWAFKNVYQVLYRNIYYCNLIVDEIPESNDAVINRIKAEAKFIRAIAQFEAVRWWGTPPFADHVFGADEKTVPNGDTKAMIDWAIQNLDDASKVLPALEGKGQQAKFGARATKHAALAYAGKVAVWYGTRYNDNAYVQKGQAYLKQVIDSGLYDLLADPRDVQRLAGDWSAEYLFEHNAADVDEQITRQNDNRQQWRNFRDENMFTPDEIYRAGWGFANPTDNFVNFMIAHDGGEDNPRFQSKLMSYDRLMSMTYSNPAQKGIIRTIPHCIGWFSAAWLMWTADIYPKAKTGNSVYSKANVAYLRYAEVLLLYAEAAFLTKTDEAGGLAALNKVRVRAGLEPLTTLTYQAIKDERRAELFGEQERYFDIVRWGEGATALADKGKKQYSFNGYKADGVTWDVVEESGTGTGWSDKWNILPFPETQLTANPELTQNPGW